MPHQMFDGLISRFKRLLASFRPPVRRQTGALCWRLRDGGIEILLVTTRRTGRWTPPKGGLMNGKSPAEAAAIEAWEEAGAIGAVESTDIGAYHYVKFRKDQQWEQLAVDVFPLEVEHLEDDYPEEDQRMRQWFKQEKAAELVHERRLKKLIRGFTPPS